MRSVEEVGCNIWIGGGRDGGRHVDRVVVEVSVDASMGRMCCNAVGGVFVEVAEGRIGRG